MEKKEYAGRKHIRVCRQCKKEFIGVKNGLYCSPTCAKKWYGQTTQFKNNISTGTVGAIQELRVSVDLLSKGYEVFRALSPASSCDLLVLINNKFFGIEVRTGYAYGDGRVRPSCEKIKAEYLALALPDKIIYKPELPI